MRGRSIIQYTVPVFTTCWALPVHHTAYVVVMMLCCYNDDDKVYDVRMRVTMVITMRVTKL